MKIELLTVFRPFWIAISLSAMFVSACSVPTLESPECSASRGTVKEFYSVHFGNEMKITAESLKPKEKFLTAELIESVRGASPETDVFTTGTTDIPKAFRVGGCELSDSVSTKVEIILFWRDDSRSEERKIYAEVVKRGDKWLINRILN